MNIVVDLNYPIQDGTEVVFRSPVDCSQVTGLKVYYQDASQEFMLADAHGNNVGDIDHLFAENVVVKVILDVTTGMAFVQNADTNAYLERRFAECGLTTKQITALDNMFKVCSYNNDPTGAYAAFVDAFKIVIPSTGIRLSASALNFTETGSKILTATVEPENSTDIIVWTSSRSSVATVENGVVTPVANGSCVISVTTGRVSASCLVKVAFGNE